MRKLAWDNSFRRAFKKYTRHNQKLKELIFNTLDELAKDPFQAKLKTHKLSGQLKGLLACWVEYDCRIIFAFEYDTETKIKIHGVFAREFNFCFAFLLLLAGENK